jgi:hypothetical protein
MGTVLFSCSVTADLFDATIHTNFHPIGHTLQQKFEHFNFCLIQNWTCKHTAVIIILSILSLLVFVFVWLFVCHRYIILSKVTNMAA